MKLHLKLFSAFGGLASVVLLICGIIFWAFNPFFYGLMGMFFFYLLASALRTPQDLIEAEARKRFRAERMLARAVENEKARLDFEAAVEAEMDRLRKELSSNKG